MLDGIDFEPVFFAPFVSSVMTVEPGWVDHNGHLHSTYYTLLFEQAVDEAVFLVGLGPHLTSRAPASFFTVEAHQRFERSLQVGHQVRVTLRLINYDEKRMHLFQELHHAGEGWTAATCEQIAQHVEPGSRRVSPFPDEVLERLALMRAAHGALPLPDGLGRPINMPIRLS
ncbi:MULTISPECIES: thioesterase family protein [unclassified Ancylobacter]|uniref:thioesterase family protein n=1 Tax=unclassified Ancylobacter TaxID=2626613 RepID=UPI00226E6F92|nr:MULTISPECIES: thioesterase family protein [unclassified Ancylobacter]WAC28861.1 thioesterase family protein [Ancylobacter sp. SL191]WGD28759.1 thioesterase family protein [Ancylobacter sp. WKF20]